MPGFIPEEDGPIKNLKQELLQHSKELQKVRKAWEKAPPDGKVRKALVKEYQARQKAVNACKKQLDEMLDYLTGE